MNRPVQITCPMPIAQARARKTLEARPVFQAHIFGHLKKKKILDLQIFS